MWCSGGRRPLIAGCLLCLACGHVFLLQWSVFSQTPVQYEIHAEATTVATGVAGPVASPAVTVAATPRQARRVLHGVPANLVNI